MKRPLAVIGFTMLGTLFVFSELNNYTAMGIAFAATLIAFLVLISVKPLRKYDTAITSLITVAVSLCLLFAAGERYRKTVNAYEDKTVNAVGYLCELPYSDYGKYYYSIRTSEIDGENANIKIRLVSSKPVAVEPTDEINVTARLYRLGKSENSYLDYYKSKNLFLGANIISVGNIERHSVTNISPLLLSLRAAISDSIMNCLDSDRGAVICAMLIGEKGELSDKAELAFRNCGISHLFAVSGLHISIWALAVYSVIKKLRASERTAAVLSICFCFFFMLLTGFNPSVVRAGFMLILLFAEKLVSEEADAVNSIGLALTVLLLLNPFNAVSVSLWLSLLATLSLVTVSPLITKSFAEKADGFKSSPLRKGLLRFAYIAVATASITAFTMPVSVFVFGRISLMSLPSNLLMVAIGSVCMQLSGIAVLLILTGLSFAGLPLLRFCGILSQFLITVAERLSSFGFGLFDVSSTASKIVVIASIAVFAILFIAKVKDKKIIIPAVSVCAIAFITANIFCFILYK